MGIFGSAAAATDMLTMMAASAARKPGLHDLRRVARVGHAGGCDT
jgi:hypothetical protein